MPESKVLVIEADRVVRDAIVTCLRFVGLEAHGAEGAAAARRWLSSATADVMVVSDRLPDGAPSELFAQRDESGAAVVMLTGGHSSGVRTNYLADATLLRPISVGRVVEQVETLLRASRGMEGEVRTTFGALTLDSRESILSNGGRELRLARIEARLLRYFMTSPERVFSRPQLLERLWPANVRVEERTVDAHVRRLRLALGSVDCGGYLQTVRGSGYRFSVLPQ